MGRERAGAKVRAVRADDPELGRAGRGTAPRTTRTPPPFGFKPLPSLQESVKENRTMPETPKLSLRALMDLIENHAGNREAGQLDVYRVFVRVDTSLLKRNGIETLKFTDDRLFSRGLMTGMCCREGIPYASIYRLVTLSTILRSSGLTSLVATLPIRSRIFSNADQLLLGPAA
jgi:hypothetical protein